MTERVEITFELNGQAVRVQVSPEESLLDTLRERLGVKSTKNGCQPQGQCGACLALVDGKARTTCALPAVRVAGRVVVTMEGLPAADRDLLARCLVAAGAVQCGFCTPGFALRAKALVDQNPSPSRAEIKKAVDGNLCRCTGYARIVDGILAYAAARRGEDLPAARVDGGVGASVGRAGGHAAVLGEQPFVDDLAPDDLLAGAVLLSPHARAGLVAIDTAAAAAMPGVEAVVTAADVPGERWYGLVSEDWPGFVAVGEETRCIGDVIAAVAAADIQTARRALAAIEVSYDPRAPVCDPEAALATGAPLVNPRSPTGTNLLSRTAFERGDVDGALAESAHVVSGQWQTQRVEHLFLEPESALAVPRPEGGLHLYTQGQGIFDDRRQVAAFLGVPEASVFVELVAGGGAFGGKEDLSIQPHAALLAQLTNRPVRITLSREESLRMHPKRHPVGIAMTAGCDRDGHLTAVRASLLGDSGAYASVGAKVLERAAGHACGPYRVPIVDIESRAVYTNNPPCGAMRGFGVNQVSFALEGCIDQLAEATGLDGWEIRWRNAVTRGDLLTTGEVVEKSVGIRPTLEAVRETYHAARARGAAVGIACALKNSGIGNGVLEWGRARLVVEQNETVSIYNGFTEMGQGLFTILAQLAGEVTGLPASLFDARVDATFEVGCGQTTGSRATLLGGRAVIAAAEKLAAALAESGSLGQLRGEVFAGEILIDDTTAPGADVEKIKTHTAYGYATQVVELDETGRLAKVTAAHDVGRVINPDLCSGQIEGGVHMGLGHALTEELPCVGGMPVTFKLRELGPLRARDMPEVDVIFVEEHEPEGPFGAKGVGEIGLVPTAGAVAGALYAFDGVRRYRLPMKDSPAAKALGVGRIKGGREGWS